MKRLVLLTLSVFCVCAAFAQEQGPLDAIARTLSSGESRFNYSFEVKGDIPMKGNGAAALCGEAYHIFGNEMEIWCDGKTRWTIDRNTCEAYVEAVDADAYDYISNPATLLEALPRAFEIRSVSDVTLGGKALKLVRLVPAVGDTGLKSVGLYLDGAVPARVSITVDDGTETLFRLTGFTVREKSDASAFAFDIASLGADYVVTDLR